jgi:acyl-CoA synthetase (AMP-forming)/AMP-acid ligase II
VLPHLRHIYAGGAPVFPRLLDSLQRLAPQAEITAIYGSTEAEPIAHVTRSQIRLSDAGAMLQGQGLLAGVPVPELEVRVLREQWGQTLPAMTAAEFTAQCLSAGSAGEIVVSGAHVLPGYVDGHGDEETKFRVEGQIWHRTGDLGYFDADGRLWLLGRCAARIEDQRGTLYPFAVECAVSAHDAVRRAAVAALDGQRVLALELDRRLQQPDMLILKKMVAWAGIDQLRIYAHLPVDKRHNAKIDYPALKKLLAR